MSSLADATVVINGLALAAGIAGYSGFVYLQMWRDQEANIRHTLPLLCFATTLSLIGAGIWINGPVAVVVVRALIALLLIAGEVVLLNPTDLLRPAGE